MKNRKVNQLLYAHETMMGDMPIRQPFPTEKVEQIDPFLLLHHANVEADKYVDPDDAGVGPHPHRGFSPVTFIFQGGVHHRDSRGNDSVVYAGGAQWMNAGRGIVHSERPPHDIHEIGGRQEIIQLWINSPAANKTDQPAYYPLQASDVPTKVLDDGRVVLKVVSGNVLDTVGGIAARPEVNAATITIGKGGSVQIPLPSNHNVFIYLLDGKLNVDGFGIVEAHHVVLFNNDGDGISFSGLEDTRILLVSAEPLNEEVVSHGPFVMNSQTQILEAMRDYQMGRMGILIEE
ncbi:pirin family protein [Chryseolinea sp. T2]|uniref:pirin family protein n=1 Tax=Chryseolinea sp. T2 TaxID=3129255 RepID=UPI00307778B4